MTVLVVLVPLALGLGLAGLCAFLWSLRNGQYEDMDGAAVRILADDDVREDQPADRDDAASPSPSAPVATDTASSGSWAGIEREAQEPG